MISLCDLDCAGRLRGQMGIDDHPDDDADVPSEESSDSPDRAAPTDGARQHDRTDGAQVETRYRQEYYADLRSEVSAGGRAEIADDRPVIGGRAEARSDEEGDPAADERVTGKPWGETAERSRRMWVEYHRRWPPEERPPVDRSNDPPGSWRGDSNRFLDSASNGHVDERCDRIAKVEQEVVSPAMRAVESCDADRRLTGFEHRLKDRERIKDKVATYVAEKGRTAYDAVSMVKDPIRYTFEYSAERYAEGVRADLGRLENGGFEQVELRNSWTDDQYKGINSRWREPVTGQMFEVQFHTRISFEAKQLTHGAYERLRSGQADEFEEMVLEAFQHKVSAEIPIPAGATDIPDYPKRGIDAR